MSLQKYHFSREFNQPSNKVWRFLTDADKLARWLLPNDFSLSGPGQFSMWTTPNEAWNGVLHGRIDEVEIGKALSYELRTDHCTDSSYVQWELDDHPNSTTLNMQHEGPSQLIETIYQAINKTQVSGHYRKNACRPQEAVLTILDGYQKEFLEALKLEILSDPVDVERRVEKIAQQHPEYLEHIVCFAIDAYPERTVSLMNKLKSCAGKNFQKLLGISLFLLLFKGGIVDAKAEDLQAAENLTDSEEGGGGYRRSF